MQLTIQILDIAIEVLLFGFPLFVLLDFIRVLPSMIRASMQPNEMQETIPDPWDLPLQESSLATKNDVVKNVATTKNIKRKKSPRRSTSKAMQMELLPDEMRPTATSEQLATRLTFKKVQADFANKGFTLNRFPSSRYRYRVADLANCRFKKLEEAMDWLNEQPEPVEFPTHHKMELLNTVTI
ncbi:hypothetical protein NIES267_73460 (plasmid) [Calothrix parasitica NIES-267]|uniref:Uncharacterized protein n=1 Tax=Calothrix parasitica NIES-267 TaxID=1973488 RepID=A0A1Z4M2X2_9CYAN|nr:hypothetical protein NIES267_73460 [Calothrix parasitica NIES-267]